jgi:hypothetical protein
MYFDKDFTVRLRELDNDALIQTEAAVKECLDVLHGDVAHTIVRIEASIVSDEIQREFLRRALIGKPAQRKRDPVS